MDPVIVLVGRPNVGKSTLFNYLTRSRDALVADYPGLTRDRQYGRGKVGGRDYIVVDTGGMADEREGLQAGMQKQVMRALDESDAVLFLVDGRAGLNVADENLANLLRRVGKPVILLVNKTDGVNGELAAADFHGLGLGPAYPISASRGMGVAAVIDSALDSVSIASEETVSKAVEVGDQGIRVAVVGRPNVGKSTLVNRMLGEERVLVFDMPGTTRDSVFIPFERMGQRYTLIDTAGVRRRARVNEAIEKFSVIKTLQAIEAAEVVVVVLDAREGITEQDASLLGHCVGSGRALVLAVNKWDGLTPMQKDNVRRSLDLKLAFLDYAKVHFVSALHGSGVGLLFDSIVRAHRAANRDLSTPVLNDILAKAVRAHEPPLVAGRRIKLRYAHQGGQNPPIIVVHGNQVDKVPDAYRRYLINTFRKELHLFGTPVRVEFKGGNNPFEGRKNALTARQLKKRKRLLRFVKHGKQ